MEDVAEALLIDRDTVRKYYKQYQSGGAEYLLTMNYPGSQCVLSDEQLNELDAHLGVAYTMSGIIALFHRLGYVYKEPKTLPGKADAQAQEDFLVAYEKLKKNKGKDGPIYFMDATHPPTPQSGLGLWLGQAWGGADNPQQHGAAAIEYQWGNQPLGLASRCAF
jgi:transposase